VSVWLAQEKEAMKPRRRLLHERGDKRGGSVS
jgi:hypothetical protein